MNGKLKSRKFWLVAVVIVFAMAALFMGKAEWGDVTGFITLILGPYLGLNIASKTFNGGSNNEANGTNPVSGPAPDTNNG